MDSDDSLDSSSSDSKNDNQNDGPASPVSVRSNNSQSQSYGFQSRSRSPTPNEPRSPSFDSRSQSPSSPTRQISKSPINNDNRSNSALSLNSSQMDHSRSPPNGDRISRNTVHSSEKHFSDRDSIKSSRSIKSPGSDRRSNKSLHDRSSSRESAKSNDSNRSKSSNKSISPDRGRSRSISSNKSLRGRSRSVSSNKSNQERSISQNSNKSIRERSRSQSSNKSASSLNRNRPMSPSFRPMSPNSNKSISRQQSRSPSSDRGSILSAESIPRSHSRDSNKSRSSRSQKSRQDDDGNSSDSSASSRGSKRHKSFSSNLSATVPLESQAEEISDGEMELDAGKDSDNETENKKVITDNNIQISHEDLSDVSDLDSLGAQSEDEDKPPSPAKKDDETLSIKSTKSPNIPTDLRQKLDEAKNRKTVEQPVKLPEKTSKTEDCEEALDFEAEDGECVEEPPKDDVNTGDNVENGEICDEITEADKKKAEEDLEEGEVTDDEETRPEETEPRPVCRFYSRGQCTWGASCRFLHPGVTDKGNYTMFEMIRPVVPGPPPFGADFRDERPAPFGHPLARTEPPPAESAWERGLRTAKEMVRRAIKRKEQDMDFEEKKMNLTLSQDELDKENGYYTRAASPVLIEPSPPPPVKHYVRHAPPPAAPHDPYYPPPQPRHTDEYYRRIHHYEPPAPVVPVRQVRIEPDYEAPPPPPRERVHGGYRELPTHRMPDYYNDKYEERTVTVSSGHKRPHRPKREVIVQRVDSVPPPGRGDEWADPWMRSKSPGQRAGAGRSAGVRRQSYSSGSSYSSSSSSRSSSASSRSSYRRRSHRSHSRSRSGSPRIPRRRPAVTPLSPNQIYRRSGPVPGDPARRRGRGVVSPSVIVSERKAAHERASLMNPPAPSPRKAHKDIRPPSPGMMRTSAQNPPAPVKMPGTDQFGRTTKREVDRITSERRNLDPDRKKIVVAAALAARVKGRVTRSSRSSSGSDSSSSSGSDSESSYSSSTSSRDDGGAANKRKISADSRMELAAIALKAKAIDALKGERVALESNSKKRPATSPPSADGGTAAKVAALNKTGPGNSTGNSTSTGGGKKATSRREELLKQLKAVEDAIAKKRSKIN